MVGHDVIVQNLTELLIGNASLGAVIRVARGIADQDIHLGPMALGLGNQVCQVVFRRNIGGNGYRTVFAVFILDGFHHLFASSDFAGRHDDFGAMFCHP